MPGITLRVLDGADRGRVFNDLDAPITIGREEGNSIQLNDERVSRYHLKIQEDHERLVLTDLESTNGTKVNGEDIQLRILRFGDMISVGRSVLLFGSRDQIASRLQHLRSNEKARGLLKNVGAAGLDVDQINWQNDEDLQAALHTLEPPELPDRLSPAQAAQLSELLEYFHIRLRYLLASVTADSKADRVVIDTRQWQNLIDVQARLAEYLRRVGEPAD